MAMTQMVGGEHGGLDVAGQFEFPADGNLFDNEGIRKLSQFESRVRNCSRSNVYQKKKGSTKKMICQK